MIRAGFILRRVLEYLNRHNSKAPFNQKIELFRCFSEEERQSSDGVSFVAGVCGGAVSFLRK